MRVGVAPKSAEHYPQLRAASVELVADMTHGWLQCEPQAALKLGAVPYNRQDLKGT